MTTTTTNIRIPCTGPFWAWSSPYTCSILISGAAMIDITSEHIRESNLIENITDPAEIEQSMVAWDALRGADKLTRSLIC